MRTCKICDNLTDRKPLEHFSGAFILCERCLKREVALAQTIDNLIAHSKNRTGVSYKVLLEFGQEQRPDV